MRPNLIGRTTVAVAMVGGAVGLAEGGNVRFVDSSAGRGGDGQSWATAFDNLQTALDAAGMPGSGVTQIWLAGGIYKPTTLSTPGVARSATFEVVDGVSLYGHFAGDEDDLSDRNLSNPRYETILSGDLLGNDRPGFVGYEENCFHVLRASGTRSAVTLDGLTISGGNATGLEPDQIKGGGLQAVAGSFLVVDSVFRQNRAWRGGGIAATHVSSLVLLRTDFLENGVSVAASGDDPRGAAIFSEGIGDVSILQCNIEGNDASLGFSGSPVNLDNLHLQLASGTSFSGNTGVAGGAMRLGGSNGQVIDCSFVNNHANGGGGAVSGQGLISGCNFISNTAGNFGGAIFLISSATIVDCYFFDNSVTALSAGAGGAIGHVDGLNELAIHACEFYSNKAPNAGGAVWFMADQAVVSKCIFDDNHTTNAAVAAQGGALGSAYTDSLLVRDCVFSSNYTVGTFALGGAVMIGYSDEAAVIECTFQDNASSGGGGLALENNSSTIVLGSRFLGNSAIDEGGGIFYWGSGQPFDPEQFDLVNSEFSGNVSMFRGGAIWMFPHSYSNLRLTNATLSGNTASQRGGGVFMQSAVGTQSELRVTNSALWGNSDSGGMDESAQVDRLGAGVVELWAHHSCIQGYAQLTTAFDGFSNIASNPLFLDHDGADGEVGTLDDDLQLAAASPCIDVGVNNAVPDDAFDVDGNSTTSEFLSQDVAGAARFAGIRQLDGIGCGVVAIVDIGAHEHDGNGGPQPRRGDLDGNMLVNGFDLALLLGQWGIYDAGCRTADLNFDLEVDGLDLAILLGAWG